MRTKNINQINTFNLRSDLENDNIHDTLLVSKGYVGNRPTGFKGAFHEDDTWAIDYISNGLMVDSYLYTSEKEYLEDLKLLGL